MYAVDADPLTAAMAAANAAALGLGDLLTVECADATTVDLTGVDAVFCDPARRRGAGAIFDPAAYSPPWDFVVGLAERVGRTVVKVAPGIDHALIPAGAEAEWVSVDGDLVEAALWCGDLAAGDPPRHGDRPRPRAVHQLTGSGAGAAPVGPVGPLPLRPGSRGGPLAPGRRVRRDRRRHASPTPTSPTSTPTPPRPPRTRAASRSPTCCPSR